MVLVSNKLYKKYVSIKSIKITQNNLILSLGCKAFKKHNIMIRKYAKSPIIGSKIWDTNNFYLNSTLNPNAKIFVPVMNHPLDFYDT